ncbi:MAG: COX15/CtaA family protein, partial [Geminicoccaceae bacterium]
LRKTTGVALILTYVLIVLGAWVRASNSGLSCPDWPTCYGHWIPLPADIPIDAGYSYFQVMLEWLHRLIAGVFLGPLILVIGVLAWRARERSPRMPIHAGFLLLLLLVQASLGGLTVLDKNSPWSVALHLTTALILFSTLWLIFERSVPGRDRPSRSKVNKALSPLALIVWLLALATMASAAMTAKSGASLACSTWPLCDGAIIPDLDDPLIRLHSAHRWLAAITALGVLALFLSGRRVPALKSLVHGALMLMICQIALGAAVILLEVPIWTAVAHQALGVLTFAYITRILWRCGGGGRLVDSSGSRLDVAAHHSTVSETA